MKVGIDKKVCFEWLELTAFNFIETRDIKETRKMLDLQIEPILKGSESRRKVITILKGIWLDIDNEVLDLRDRALDMMPTLSREERLRRANEAFGGSSNAILISNHINAGGE